MTEKRGKNSPKDESNTTICTYQNEACYFLSLLSRLRREIIQIITNYTNYKSLIYKSKRFVRFESICNIFFDNPLRHGNA